MRRGRDGNREPRCRARKHPRPPVSTLTATAIVVADLIGVGLFTGLGFQASDIPSGLAERGA
jgi:hypothetical protein